MKWILILSLFLNGILIVLLIQEKGRPPLERIIIESAPPPSSHQAPLAPQGVALENSQFDTPKRKQVKSENSPDPKAVRAMMDKKESARKDFFQRELGFSEEDLAQLDGFKEAFQLEVEQVMKSHKSADGNLSLASKKKLLDLEHRYLETSKRFLGTARWDRYERFRAEYNQRGAEESENVPFVFMEP